MPADPADSTSADEGPFAPDRVAEHTFGKSWRGFSPSQVRAYLADLARELRAARKRERELHDKVECLEADVEKVKGELDQARGETAKVRIELEAAKNVPPPKLTDLDDHQIAELLGEETARILEAAKEAAATIRSSAEEKAAGILTEANDKAAQLRSEADDQLRVQTEAAHDEAAKIVAEAEGKRHEVLGDLAQRRRLAKQHMAQLQASRERLLEAYGAVRSTLDEVTNDLEVALPAPGSEVGAPGALGDDAGATDAVDDLEPTIEELEAELALLGPLVAPASPTAELDAGVSSDSDASDADADGAEGDVDADGAESETESNTESEPTKSASSADAKTDEPDATKGESPDPLPESEPEQEPDLSPDPVESSVPDTSTIPKGLKAKPGSAAAAAAMGDAAASKVGTKPKAVEPAKRAKATDRKSVDDLFARLRAERAGRPVAEAGDSSESEPVVDDKPAPEPAPVVEAELASDAKAVGGTNAEPSTKSASGSASAPELATETASADPSSESEPTTGGPEHRALFERRDALVVPVQQELSRRIKRHLANEQNEVLDRVRRLATFAADRSPTIDDVLPPLAEQLAGFGDTAKDPLGQARNDGGGFFDGADASRARGVSVDDLAGELAELLVSLVRERVDRAVADVGTDEDELTTRVRAAYREWKAQRVSETVHHYVIAAFTRGLYEAHRPGTAFTWVMRNGDSPCVDCDDNTLAGAVVKGAPFPTESFYPPAHPGCACLLVPEGEAGPG